MKAIKKTDNVSVMDAVPVVNSEQEFIKLLLLEHERNLGHITSIEDFKEDVMRFIYIGRILKKFNITSDFNGRLLINHLTIVYNVFGNSATSILFMMVEQKYHSHLFSLLAYFKRIPTHNIIQCIDGTTVDLNYVERNDNIIAKIEHVLDTRGS